MPNASARGLRVRRRPLNANRSVRRSPPAAPLQLLRKFLALEADDRRFFARAWLALARHRWRILRAAPSRLAAEVGRAMAAPPGPSCADDVARARRRMLLLRRAGRHHVVAVNCLLYSLTGRELLAGDGVAATLRIGVARGVDGELSAHAWLEVGGVVVNDAADVASRFAPLDDPRVLTARAVDWR